MMFRAIEANRVDAPAAGRSAKRGVLHPREISAPRPASHRDELRELVDGAERHERNCEALRARYGSPAPGRRVVELEGPVENAAASVVAQIQAAAKGGSRELCLMIDSTGGLSSAREKIINALDTFRGRKIGVVVGYCSSAASVILAACGVRIAPATASFLIHACGYYADYPLRWTARSHDQEASRLAGTDRQITETYRRVGSRTLMEMVNGGEDHRIDAIEAKRLNLLTAIEPAPSGPASFNLTRYFSSGRAAAKAKMAALTQGAASFLAIKIKGEIGARYPASAVRIRKQLATAPYARSMLVSINSPGGNVDEASQIFAAIMEHPAARKKAIIYNVCASAALLPLLACPLRVARPGAEILLHRSSLSPYQNRDDRWTADRHALAAQEIEKLDTAMVDLLVEKTGHDRDFFVRQMADEKPMQLTDALACGIVHAIDGQTREPDYPAWPAQSTRAQRLLPIAAYLAGDRSAAALEALANFRPGAPL